ncbi:MAG: hypothetical protein ACRCS8_01245 [Brevinema sp.]
MKKISNLMVGILLMIPLSTNAAYIDTRDLTPEIKQVNRLIGAQRSQGGGSAASAAAISTAVLGLGLGMAIASTSSYYYYRPYYHRPHPRYRYHGGYYRRGPSTGAIVGGSLLAIGSIAAISIAASQAEEAADNSASIENQIAQILKGLVNTDEDFKAESSVLNEKLTQQEKEFTRALEEKTKTALSTLYAPSNTVEENYRQNVAKVNSKYPTSKMETGLQSLSNQLLGLDPTEFSKKEIKSQISSISKALKKTNSDKNKDMKKLDSAIKKDRKSFKKTLSKPADTIIANAQSSYDSFMEKGAKEIEALFQRYYRVYHKRIL